MKIYIVSCGEYDGAYNAKVTTDFSCVPEFILERAIEESDSHRFRDLECWEDEKCLYIYGCWNDLFENVDDLTIEKIEKDILLFIEERVGKVWK